MKRRIALRTALLLLAAVALPRAALAQSCQASNASVAFGNVDVVAGSQNYAASYSAPTSNITVTCNVGLLSLGSLKFSACINLDGASGGATRTIGGAGSPSYNLYSDAGHGTVWGATGSTPGPVSVSLAITSVLLGATASTSVPIYGYMLSNLNNTVVPGTYNGGPNATVSYNYTYAVLGTPSNPPSCSAGPSGSNGSSSFSLAVSATVTHDCSVSATTISFGGSVGVLTGAIPSTGTITATCTSGDAYTLSLNKGTTSGASLADRQMAGSGSAVVHYQLYTNSSHTTVWGDSTAGTATLGGNGTGNSQNYTVYGLVPQQSTPAPATYNDTVTVTVTY